MKTTLLMAAIAAGMTLAATAEARPGQGDRIEMPAFEELDLNTDGAATLQEIETAMQTLREDRFAQADTNGDGGLSAEEMLAAGQEAMQERMAARIEQRIEGADANGDGLLQADEMAEMRGDRGRRGANPERMFNRFDANEDGALSAEEYAAALERIAERGPRGGHGDK